MVVGKGVLYLYLAKPQSALCCMKKFNSNTWGGVIVGKGVLYLYLAKPLSDLCCVKKFSSNTYGDFLLLKHVTKSLQWEMDE